MLKTKIIIFTAILSLTCSAAFARDYPVRDWLEFFSAYNASDGDIISVIEDSIIFQVPLTNPSGTNVLIRSNSSGLKNLDGNKTYRGFAFSNTDLTFLNINLTKFYINASSGGAINANASTITFNGLNVNLTSNTALGANNNGGAIAALNSRVDFVKSDRRLNLTVLAAYNLAGSGGFAYLNSSTMSFSDTILNFLSNSATNGAGIYSLNSFVNFSNSSVTFRANQGNYGIALEVFNYSEVNLDNTKVYITSNIVKTSQGGSIYATGAQSKIILNNSLLDFKNNVNASGWTSGIMLVGSSIFNVNDSEVNFTSNTATGLTSLAINNSSAVFRNSRANFIRNTAVYASTFTINYGAAALIVWNGANSNANFIDSRVIFTSNSALGASVGGAVTYGNNGGKILFENSITTFTHNVSEYGYGGAIALYGVGGIAWLDFRGGRVSFIDNSAGSYSDSADSYGGAIADSLILSASVNFSSMASAYFLHNVAISYGGAITLLSRSTTNFYGSDVNFTANTSVDGNGGAIYMDRSRLSFIKSAVSFSSNAALNGDGGAFYAQDAPPQISFLNFSSSNINFAFNSAQNGGALYLQYVRTVFEYGVFVFEGNKSQLRGGALYVDTARTTFNNVDLRFNNNTALSSGGAIYQYGEMRTSSHNVLLSFIGNKAYAGGAIYFKGYGSSGDSMEFANIIAKDNIAVSLGGAIYIEPNTAINLQSQFKISALDRDVLFDNNKMANGAIPNDIYIESKTDLIFNAAENRNITLNGGILGGFVIGDASTIRKIGAGNMYLAPSDFRGRVVLDEGILYTAVNSTISGVQFSTFSILEIGPNAKFSTVDNFKDRINVLNLFVVIGSLEMEINYSKNEADFIYGYEVFLSTYSILGLKITGGGASDTIIGSSVPVIFADRTLINRFKNDRIIDRRIIYDVITTTKNIGAEIWVKASEIISLQSHAITHNQKAVTPFIEDYIDLGKTNRITEALMSYASKGEYDNFRSVLDAIHGQIYANVLRTGARNVGLNSLYERITPQYDEAEIPAANIWVELYAAGNTIAATKNASNGDFKSDAFGFRVGGDLFSDKSKNVGIYLRYGANNFTQGVDEAFVGDIEFGLYGGLFNLFDQSLDIKGNLSGGLQQYDVSRKVLGLNPKSDFNALSVRGGIEADYLIFIPNNLIFTPFISLNAGYTTNPEIDEINGEEANLKISNNSYLRFETLFGIGLSSNKNDKFNWAGKIYGKILAEGDKTEYDNQFSDMNSPEFRIKGYEEDVFSVGVALSGKYQFNSKISAGINVNGELAANTNGYFAGAFFNYKIGGANIQTQTRNKPVKTPKPMREYDDSWRFVDEDINIAFGQQGQKEEPIDEPVLVEISAKPVDELGKAQYRRKNALISFQLLAAVFEPNSAVLSPISKRSIKEIAEQIKKIPKYKMITVEGHTDSIGDNQNNDALSVERAKAVSEELAKNGIDESKIQYIGLGKKLPIRSDATLLGRQANRRVEIYVE
ncbi:MAG: autotransporter domain-containing protein [Endomicrobium sp.]|jgi:predicted outer membrane repeat protein|nr:autotransporter domain-containing protein [Endomicrobium sp.]